MNYSQIIPMHNFIVCYIIAISKQIQRFQWRDVRNKNRIANLAIKLKIHLRLK